MDRTTRSLSLLLVTLFVGSLLSGAALELTKDEVQPVLTEEPVVQAATSPGHVVFGQYISSDNCPHCAKPGGGSESNHNLKQSNPDEYVYITYMSQSYGSTATARAGNVAPYNWAWTSSGAPIHYMGDRTDSSNTQSGASSSGTNYDAMFTAGGGMHSTAADYKMTASISPNGNVFDIAIDYQYIGSGTAASNLNLYAAIVEEDCTTHTYNNMGSGYLTHGYHCWMGWLTAGNTYKSASGGSGSAFASVSPSSTAQSVTWSSVPTSLIAGGTSNAMVIGVLMSGSSVSVGGSSPHVYHAVDSTMGPKMDIAVTDLRLTNDEGGDAYVRGDMISLEADVKNVGDLDYTSGGTLEFYYRNGPSTTVIDSTTVPTLNAASGAPFLTATASFDTSVLPQNTWTTDFGARLTGVTGESTVSNNVAMTDMEHDRPPVAKTPQIIDTNVVQRGEYLTLLAKGDADDNVDTIDTLSFEVEVSPTGANTWSDAIVAGGDEIVYRDTAQEGRKYILTPIETMAAGMYDVRTRTVDSRMQVSAWSTASELFELANGIPRVIADPVPSVMCDISTRVSMDGHIVDAETPLADLVVDSTSPYFVAWHPASEEIEVLFPHDGSCPLGQRGIEVTVDDGGDYEGALPYGTLQFNVIENGQPRWAGLPIQSVDEGGSGSLGLADLLTDTDDSGNPADINDLTLSIIGNSNPGVFNASIRDAVLNFATVDDDVNGETVLTLRASDGEQYSDQTVTLRVNPINDAPRLDLTDLETITIKRGKQMVINLKNRMVDVDNPIEQAFISVTPDEPGAARYNLLDGNMIINFEETGDHTITVSTTDGFDTNVYTIAVDVYDALPFYFSKVDDGGGYMHVSMVNTYIGQSPTATLTLTETAPVFTNLDLTVQLCSELTGLCYEIRQVPLNVAASNVGWTQELDLRTSGSQMRDYYQFKMSASDEDGDDYKTLGDGIKFLITENLPAPADMDDEMLTVHVDNLNTQIEALKTSIEAGEGDVETMTEELATLQADFDVACDDPRANCPEGNVESSTGDAAEGGLDTNVILIVVGVLIIAALLGLMFMRGGRGDLDDVDTKWNDASLPFHDHEANSMYGGAQAIFQQPLVTPTPAVAPVAAPTPAPVVAPVTPEGPPLPAGGLPAGWTMEQWAYYGHQYVPAVPAGPALPASGLPAGWTMEQWTHYGQQYLDSLNG